MKLTFFKLKRELQQNQETLYLLQRQDLFANFYMSSLIKNVVKAEQNHKYYYLFSALSDMEYLKERKIDDELYQEYQTRLTNLCHDMNVSESEVLEVLRIRGTEEQRKRLSEEELDFLDFLFENTIKKMDKCKRMQK